MRQLKMVLTVADVGSIFGAAEQFYLSRPGVSKSIAQLLLEGRPLLQPAAEHEKGRPPFGGGGLSAVRRSVKNKGLAS